MGTTGSSPSVSVSQSLPALISRVRKYATVSLAVGFGVATRQHFEIVADAGADGVVIGSRLISIIKTAPQGQGQIIKYVEEYCREISLQGQPPKTFNLGDPDAPPRLTDSAVNAASETGNEVLPAATADSPATILPARFGQFGGQYVPEALFDCLIELEDAHKRAIADPEFWKEFESTS
jgi:tryptophan synthase